MRIFLFPVVCLCLTMPGIVVVVVVVMHKEEGQKWMFSRVLFSRTKWFQLAERKSEFFNSSIQSEDSGWPGNNAEMPCPALPNACSPDLRGQGFQGQFP
jgi:hypothetical protein